MQKDLNPQIKMMPPPTTKIKGQTFNITLKMRKPRPWWPTAHAGNVGASACCPGTRPRGL